MLHNQMTLTYQSGRGGVRRGLFYVNLKRMMMNAELTHLFIHHILTGCMLRDVFPELPLTSLSLPGLVHVAQG